MISDDRIEQRGFARTVGTDQAGNGAGFRPYSETSLLATTPPNDLETLDTSIIELMRFSRGLLFDLDTEPFGLFIFQPAHHAILEVNHGDHDQRSERNPLPAEQVVPGNLLEQVKQDRADHRSPQGPLPPSSTQTTMKIPRLMVW